MADTQKISTLTNVGQVDQGDLFIVSKQAIGGTWISRSASATDIALAILGVFQNPELMTENKDIYGAINELTPQPLTKAEFFDDYSNIGDFYAWKVGKLIIINRLSFNSVKFDGSVVTGALIKEQYRPGQTIRTITDVGGGSLFARCNIRNTGEMAISYGTSTATNNSYMFATTYMAA